MRMNLKVPFAEKEEAKQLGARWDAARKTWYLESDEQVARFARWSPTPAAATAPGAAPPGRLVAAGKLVVGGDYVETAPLCGCPPWEVCERCQPAGV